MKILVKTIAGSHLFGTNTPQSDKDFKGVFLPSADDILLGKFDQTVHQHTNNEVGQKNTKDDVDIEFYSLDKFLKMLYQGQTVAWELLFTPDEFIIEKHPLWDEIRAETPKFLNKKVDAFIGYCKQQAHKYGVRGSRMNTLETVLEHLKSQQEKATALYLGDINLDVILELEHVERIPDKNGKDLIHICGKKFSLDTKLYYIIQPLKKYYDEYGERSRKAKDNEGIDWKALSHAVRVCFQAENLLTYGKLILPLPMTDRQILKDIKAGEWTFEEVSSYLEDCLDKVNECHENSTLPAEPNLEAFQEIQKHIYGKHIVEEYTKSLKIFDHVELYLKNKGEV